MYGEEKGIDLRLFLLVLKNCDKVEADPARAAASADTDIEDEGGGGEDDNNCPERV